MVVEGSGASARWGTGLAYLAAIAGVLPLVAPEAWSGVRLALADPVLSALSALEQPLSVRSPGGPWAVGVALVWFGLVVWHRNFALWEATLVLIGGAAALARVGNLWVDAAALILPVGRQVALLRIAPFALACAATGCLVVTGFMVIQARPPELASAAIQAVRQTTVQGKVLADWRWAGELQQQLGPDRHVLASGGIASEPTGFWVDYLRIADGHERWASLLRQFDVNTVVLDAGGEQQRAAELVRASAEWHVSYDVGDTLVAERTSP